MTTAKKAEHEYRSNPAPRIPRLKDPLPPRQWSSTLVALVVILAVLIGYALTR